MIEKVSINLDITKGKFKDGNLLIYDKKRNCYYEESLENVFCRQDAKIAELKADYEARMKELEDREKIREANYRQFLENYQKTNARLIEMVESVVSGGNE